MPVPNSWVAQFRAAAQRHLALRTFAKTGRLALTAVKWVCAYHLFTTHIGGPRIVDGPSMLPTMNVTGDLVLEDTLSRHLSPPRIKRGDLVTLQSPQEPTKTICKRVIGLPGDTICVHPDKVAGMYTTAVASGKASARESDNMADPNSLPWELEHVLVPKGHIWISGDNLPYSRDSRTHGPIPIALVRGKIWARIYPSPQLFRDPVVYID